MIYRPLSNKGNLKASLEGHGWQESTKYVKSEVEKFKDDVEGVVKLTSSIPSPYARMFLIDQAFKIVNGEEGDNIDGNTVFHFEVSHCLDLFQLLYSKDALKDKIKIVKWQFGKEIKYLTQKESFIGHQLLGRTLQDYRENSPLSEYLIGKQGGDRSGIDHLYFFIYNSPFG